MLVQLFVPTYLSPLYGLLDGFEPGRVLLGIGNEVLEFGDLLRKIAIHVYEDGLKHGIEPW
jgi:hypothetical protein